MTTYLSWEMDTKQGVSSSMSSNDIGQQTISPIQAQFYLFFKNTFLYFEFSVKQMADL